MNNEMRVCIAKELAYRRFYNEEKFMMLLRAVPDDVLVEWIHQFSENIENYFPVSDDETDDDLDTRDANGTVLSVDVNSIYPN
jgi:hypothetical protein